MRARSFPGVALVAIGLSAIQGCAIEQQKSEPLEDDSSSPTPVTLVPEAVTVPQTFADAVDVQADRLVVPSTQPDLASIKVGSIVAGNRAVNIADLDASKNPVGFLRRVTAIGTEGGNTVLTTEHADLADWIEEGDLDFGSDEVLVGAPKALTPRGLSPQGGSSDKSVEGSGTAKLDGSQTADPKDGRKIGVTSTFKFTNANFKMNAKFVGHWNVKKKGFWKAKVPVGLDTGMLLTLDPSLAASIEATVNIGAAGGGQATLFEKSWKPLPRPVQIPLPGPIPATLSFEPILKCSLTAGASAQAVASASISSHAQAGFSAKAGLTDWEFDNLTQAPSAPVAEIKLVASGKAEMKAECEVLVEAAIQLFDAAQISVTAGPKISLTASACAAADGVTGDTKAAFSLYENHSFSADFNVRIQVPVIHAGKDEHLGTYRTADSAPYYLVGNGDTCELNTVKYADSCAGKSDGFYCSSLAANSGIYCVGGQTTHGKQCASSLKCIGGDKTSIRCK